MKPLLDCAFQPIVHESGNVYAYEALMRFKGHPDQSPLPLIRHWEKSGYIETVDMMMVDVVCAAVMTAAWKPRIAINVSVRTIEAAGSEYVAKLAFLASITQHLVIEVTETAKISNATLFLQFIKGCRDCGYHIALDDCEPGHPFAFPGFMQSIRPSIVKVDGLFFQNSIRTGAIDALLGLIYTAHRSQARVIIEHVSSVEHRNRAFSYGADLVQGYETGMPGQLTNCTFAD
ncbi:MAG: hypothetical protein B7Z60_07195 [Ferrovum sp. 37-45-19]|nr:MAG: hypothetical protein B7Z65_06990 [Ferrovum sp. 21-44-67]OYV93864.1 MAG: hypothetical protein B7Z60_07195 [Ferrovum sp. 37-45-19]HQT82030.1 EAL domain-containing protein [Ferrovaceae bacterium]HQU07154.1 EAL domain-containing protein [Ferrovaceae bacterium]